MRSRASHAGLPAPTFFDISALAGDSFSPLVSNGETVTVMNHPNYGRVMEFVYYLGDSNAGIAPTDTSDDNYISFSPAVSYGSQFWIRGDLTFDVNTDPHYNGGDGRKLIRLDGPGGSIADGPTMTLYREAEAGTHNYNGLRVILNQFIGGVFQTKVEDSLNVNLMDGTTYTMEVGWTISSGYLATDGDFIVYINNAPVYQYSSFSHIDQNTGNNIGSTLRMEWGSAGSHSGPGSPFFRYGEQCTIHAGSQLYEDRRFWGRCAGSSSRVGP